MLKKVVFYLALILFLNSRAEASECVESEDPGLDAFCADVYYCWECPDGTIGGKCCPGSRELNGTVFMIMGCSL